MAHASRAQFRNRVRIIGAFFSVLSLVFLARTYMLQIVHGETYREDASGQYVSLSTDYFDRGNIFLTQKDGTRVAGASVSREYILAIEPFRLTDPEATYTALSAIVSFDRETFFARAAKRDDPHEEIKRGLSEGEAEAVRALAIPGVALIPTRTRFYPGENLAAHTIGFIAFDNDVRVGRYGIERYYETVLKRDNTGVYKNAFTELFGSVRELVFVPATEQEGDVITSIEPSVQLFLEQALAE